MKKLKYILVLVLLVPLVPFSSLSAANNVSTTAATNIELTDPSMVLVLATGASYNTMTVNTGSVAFTLSAGGSISLSSAQGYTLANDQSQSTTCAGSGQTSTAAYSLAAGVADSTITFTPTLTKCWPADNPTYNPGGGGGGGGGGGAITTPAPTTDTTTPADESAGEGETTDTVGANATGNVGQVTSKGKNALMGEAATATFSLSQATGTAAGSHSMKVQNITVNQATITISSNPVVFTLLSGSSKNVDIDGDGYRDMTVTLNRITDGNADVTIDEIKVVKIENAVPGSLVKIDGMSAVYYLGEDSQRYVFPNAKVYYSWYDDFSNVTTISAEDMAKLPLGGLVTYRPGTRMVTFVTTVDVYTVTKGNTLRKLKDEVMAKDLYGENWNQHIDDVNDAFYSSYTIGDDLSTSSEYNKDTQKAYTETISVDNSL
ncbi:MAG: hypothetical protein ABIJ91_01640 [Candidatus Kuenenbacteria bacterium]